VLLLDEPVNGLDPEGVAWEYRTCAKVTAVG
jgi:ABC-type multidrug transport system ATPase subunit